MKLVGFCNENSYFHTVQFICLTPKSNVTHFVFVLYVGW